MNAKTAVPSDQTRASTGFVLDPGFRLHDTGRGHPECAERLDAIETALQRQGLMERLQRIETPGRDTSEKRLGGVERIRLHQHLSVPLGESSTT